MSLLFVAGIPASGKSHFGRWLQAIHGYLHIDAEIPGQLDAYALHEVWDAGLRQANAGAFVEAVQALGRPVVLNWGFPPRCLPFVTSLRSEGFAVWWFDADYSAARLAYSRLGRPVEAFDRQIAVIQAAWPAIEEVFAPNIIRALNARGARRREDAILQVIRGDTPRRREAAR